jgi:hypothetical protein
MNDAKLKSLIATNKTLFAKKFSLDIPDDWLSQCVEFLLENFPVILILLSLIILAEPFGCIYLFLVIFLEFKERVEQRLQRDDLQTAVGLRLEHNKHAMLAK